MRFPSCKNSKVDDTFYSFCTGCLIQAGHYGCVLNKTEEMGKYILEGKTPNGGVKALLFFKGVNDEPVVKSEAHFVEIQELDLQGRIIHIEHATFDPYRPPNTVAEDKEQ